VETVINDIAMINRRTLSVVVLNIFSLEIYKFIQVLKFVERHVKAHFQFSMVS
jgi:hypothetical protein